MPRSRTPAVLRESHHCDSSVLASVTLTTSPTAFMLLTLLTASGKCASPVAYVVLCVRFAPLVHICRSQNRLQHSARDATLDTGGWLDRARQGLSPCKKRQASLAALTFSKPALKLVRKSQNGLDLLHDKIILWLLLPALLIINTA